MPMPYTTAEIAASLTAPSRRWDFRYDRLGTAGQVLAAESVVSCSVANNALADNIKRTCRAVLPETSEFNPLSDRLRPYARLLMPDGFWQEWPLGTFYLSTSTVRAAAAAGDDSRSFEGYDVLEVLLEDKVTARYVVAAGTAYTTAVSTVLTGAGLAATNVATSAKTLPAPMEWPPGTPKLTIVNDLLAAIDYAPIYADPLGVPVANAYVDPDAATPLWTYTVDAASVVRPGMDLTLDLYDTPNVFLAAVSEPDRPPLLSSYTNSDPDDPLSTVNRGRSIVRVLEPSEVGPVVDQATLDAKVARIAAEAGQTYEDVSFTTGLMPIHGNHDVILVDVGGAGEATRYREVSWEMDLVAGGEMKHTARRVVPL